MKGLNCIVWVRFEALRSQFTMALGLLALLGGQYDASGEKYVDIVEFDERTRVVNIGTRKRIECA